MFKKTVDLKAAKTKKQKPKKSKLNYELSKPKKFFHKLSGAFALPIIVMSFAGLLYGIGLFMVSLQDAKTGLVASNHTIRIIGEFIANVGKPIFWVMPLFFAMAIVIVFTESAGISVFSVVLAYLTFLLLQSTFIDDTGVVQGKQPNFIFDRGAKFALDQPLNIYQTILGIKSLKTGIFGAVIVGVITSLIFNLLSKAKFPRVFSYFIGERIVPIMVLIAMIPLAIIFVIIWPYVAKGIELLSQTIVKLDNTDKSKVSEIKLGAMGTGLISRLLMPFGLHDIFTQNVYGVIANQPNVAPALNINHFFQGQYPISIMILPATAIAMIFAAPKGNRIVAFGALFPATITCMLTGITEPLEFALLFMAPLVFMIFQGIITAAAFWGMTKFGGNIQNFIVVKSTIPGTALQHVETTFIGGGLMDLVAVILNKKQVLSHEKWWLIFAVGGAIIPVVTIGWWTLIKLFKLPTPGNIVPTTLHTQEINIKSSLAQINKVPNNQKQIFQKLKKANKELLKEIEIEKEILAENKEIKKAKTLQKEEVKKAREIQRKSIEKAKEEFKKVQSKTPEEIRAANLKRGRAIRKANIAKNKQEKQIVSKSTDDFFIQKTKDGKAWELIKKNEDKNIFQDKKQIEVIKYARKTKTLKNKNVVVKKNDGKIAKRITIK